MAKVTLHTKLPVVSIKKILVLAGDEFSRGLQWSKVKDNPDWTHSVTASLHRAEIMVTTVEEFDCGSHGGFGEGQPSNQGLFERWLWLCQKYGLDYDKVKNYGTTLKTLRKYYAEKS